MLLAVDTSTAQIGLALYDGAMLIAESSWTCRNHHSIELAPAVIELLKRAGVTADQIQAIGVALGPGSFTSLRVGLSFAKGLALARKIPLIGISTMDVIAAGQEIGSTPLICVLQAGRGRLAVSEYHAHENKRQSQSQRIVTAEALAESIESPVVVCGELTSEERHLLHKKKMITLVSPAKSARRPGLLAELAFERWKNNQVDDAASLAPIYLHLAEPIDA
jgi:tRNA threonylcarbamoyladenosine biosynthesis protein TsaB